MRPKTGQNTVTSGGNQSGARGAWKVAGAGFALVLSPAPALASVSTDAQVAVVSASIAAGAVALAVAAGLWALAEQFDARRLRRLLRNSDAAARASAGARDALIAAGREPMIVWGRDGQPARSYGDAEALLDSCLEGPDATELAKSLDTLSDAVSTVRRAFLYAALAGLGWDGLRAGLRRIRHWRAGPDR